MNGECEVPENLKEFLKTLIGGVNPRRRDSEVCSRRVQSFAQDLIFMLYDMEESKHNSWDDYEKHHY